MVTTSKRGTRLYLWKVAVLAIALIGALMMLGASQTAKAWADDGAGLSAATMDDRALQPQSDTEDPSFTRIFGNVALDTMANIVDQGWAGETGGTVVLTTVDGYWDALTAAGIAGMKQAPVLMTDSGALSPQTRTVIESLKPETVVVCGGTSAVSNDVAQAACTAAGNANLVRCAGNTATGTACEVFKNAISEGFGTWSTTAFVCTNDGYWDALAAAPISYALGMPIFLTEGADSISAETLATMKEGGITSVIIVGGTAAVSDSVANAISDAGIRIKDREWGYNAVRTSSAVAFYGINQDMVAEHMGVATTNGYWDALAGAPLCGKNNSVLVLVSGPDSESLTSFVKPMKPKIGASYVFGGEMAIDAATFQALKDAIS